MTQARRVPVREKAEADRAWVDQVLTERWGGHMILLRGELVDAGGLEGLVAGERLGLATYRMVGPIAELVTLDVVRPHQGIGTALVEALWARVAAHGGRLRVTTTNDNLDALRFYQRRGFRLVALHPRAVDGGRALKPSIPQFGCYGIAIRDEVELECATAIR